MTAFPFITALTAVPLLGAFAILIVGTQKAALSRRLALGVSLVALVLTLIMWHHFNLASGDLQFQELRPWIPAIGVDYHVGVDGLGLLMLLLSAILVPMAIAASSGIHEKPGLYFSLILFLQTGLFGTFTALNFFHWFVFWELSLIPAFFLIRLWGGSQRASAATQFFVYTMVGSVALLLAFLAIFQCTGSFDFVHLAELSRNGQLVPALADKLGPHKLSAEHLALVLFFGAFLGFAVKVPLMPFHTWLPSTYAEAPTGTTMLLTGAMSKMGVYGFLRILYPIFYEEIHSLRTLLLWLAVTTVVLSALTALAQKDLKRILAYSSINHLGYCMLGIFAAAKFTGDNTLLITGKTAALDGVILQMFNHGLTAATLFWFVALLEKRSGLRGLNDFGGLRKVIPVFCGLMGITLFSSLGLPGLNGFVGEFLIFRGVFSLAAWSAAVAVMGLLLTAIFILTILQHVFFGPLNERWSAMPDLTIHERLALSLPVAIMFVVGLYPQVILSMINSTVMKMVQQVRY